MQYKNFKFIYPPRAESKINPRVLDKYDNEDYIAQPKYNGDCVSIFLHESKSPLIFNRHGEAIASHKLKGNINFQGMHTGTGWTVLAGELMTKAKKGEHNQPFNDVFVAWDLLVFQGKYLVGSKIEERNDLLDTILEPVSKMRVGKSGMLSYEHVCFTGLDGVYKAPLYTNCFAALYNSVVKTDAYEGLVLKRRSAQLDFGYNAANNFQWQIKARKTTKNYIF